MSARRSTSKSARREPVLTLGESKPGNKKTIDALVGAIRKRFGSESIGLLGETEHVIGTFSTGLPRLDAIFGVGGFPLAKLVQISGPPSVGKSTLCKWLIARAQQAGVAPYFIDGEMSQDTVERSRALGISPETLAWSECFTLERAFELIEAAIGTFAKTDRPAIIFLDSVAALSLADDADRAFDEEGRRAAKASFLSRNLPKLMPALRGTSVGMVFVNQLRQKANARPFEDPNYEPGGLALAHWSHVILRMQRLGTIGKKEDATGIVSRVTVRKSKIGQPMGQCDLNILFDARVEEADS